MAEETSSSSAPAESAAAVAGAAAAAGVASTPSQPATQANSQFGGQPAPNSILYVGNIFFEVSETSLEEYFSRFGPIKSTRIIYDARGLSKGYV